MSYCLLTRLDGFNRLRILGPREMVQRVTSHLKQYQHLTHPRTGRIVATDGPIPIPIVIDCHTRRTHDIHPIGESFSSLLRKQHVCLPFLQSSFLDDIRKTTVKAATVRSYLFHQVRRSPVFPVLDHHRFSSDLVDNGTNAGPSLTSRRHRLSTSSKDSRTYLRRPRMSFHHCSR